MTIPGTPTDVGGIQDEDLNAIAELTGTGYLQRTGDGAWELGDIDTPTVDPVVYPIDLGKTYSNLVGTPPSVLEKSWVTWATNLKDRREANCPRAKSRTYYFAANGNDDNDGSLANPWQSLTRANALMSALPGQRMNGNTLTVADSAPFALNGRSFWMGGFISNNTGFYGPLFSIMGSYGLFTGEANSTPGFFYWRGGTRTTLSSGTSTGSGSAWSYVEAWYDHTTRVLSICVNGGTVASVTLAGQIDASALPFRMGNGFDFSGSFNGDSARQFFVRDFVPTNAQRVLMRNGGKGWRSYTLPTELKSILVSNGGSFWDMAGSNGTLTYADAISGRTLTRNVAQNPVVVLGPDADSPVTSTNGVISGGGDFAVLFRRGDRFVGKFTCNRGNVTVADYGTGVKPIISDFSVSITNTWTLVTGTTFKRACSPVGWVKKVGDDVYPFDLVLFKEISAAAVQSRANSFCYDTVAGELHINVGGNPATVSPSGWEGTVRGLNTANTAAGNVNRIENLIILGSGITEPGNPSGYGLQITGTLNQEHVCKGLEVFYTGYHAIGHICTKAIGTWIDCKAGLCSSRNEAGLTSYVADGTVYVSYAGTGDQEMVMWECETNHGPLPSYDTQAGNNFAGYISHTAGADLPTLNLIYECGFTATDFPVAEAYTMGQAAITSWEQSRCWVYGGFVEGNYTSHFQIGIGLHCTYVNQNSGIRLGNIAGVLFGSLQGIWLANCTITADAASLGGAALNLFQTAAVARLVNCRVDVINSGAGGVRIANGALGAGTLFENTIFTISTTGSVILGDATTNQFDRCAFRGWTGVGTSPVNLVNTPLIDNSSNAWQLYGNGKSGLIEYDAGGRARRLTPTIGPFELTEDDQTDANSFSTAAFVNASVAGKQNALTLTTTGSSGAATLTGSTLNIPQYSGGGGGGVAISGTPTTGQAAEWTNATTVQGVGTTGSGNYVKANSPSMTSPNVGAASATSLTATGNVTADQLLVGGASGPRIINSSSVVSFRNNPNNADAQIRVGSIDMPGGGGMLISSTNFDLLLGSGATKFRFLPWGADTFFDNTGTGSQIFRTYPSGSAQTRMTIGPTGLVTISPNSGVRALQTNGQTFVQSSATSEIPLITRGVASQTANLHEWQDSAGATLASVSASGAVRIGSGTAIASVLSATATLDFPSIAAGASATLTITLTGAVAGDCALLGIPSAAFVAGISYEWAITSANTATVRATNTTAAAIDPPSGTFRITVVRF